MSKIILAAYAALTLLAALSCKKNNKPPEPSEEQLSISTDATALNEVPGSVMNFKLTVLSVMPPSGVKFIAVVKGETDNVTYYSSPFIETSLKTTDAIINSLPKQKICICTITVTSKTKSSNTATTSFRVVYK